MSLIALAAMVTVYPGATGKLLPRGANSPERYLMAGVRAGAGSADGRHWRACSCAAARCGAVSRVSI